jgi:hypothetical protein
VDGVVRGQWDRRAMLAIEAAAAAAGFTEPSILARRVRFKLVTKRRCPLLRSVFFADRRIPGDVDRWIAEVGKSHAVYWPDGRDG